MGTDHLTDKLYNLLKVAIMVFN